MNEDFDFIAVGDITTDAFIKLKEAEVNCDINQENCTLSMRFGDKIPYESVTVVPAVGNSPNAAVAAARLGLKSAVITNVGDDQEGKEAIGTLEKNGVDTRFVKINTDKKTNYHYVLWYGAERTILIKHEEFDYALPPLPAPKWIYLSSLGENSLDFHHDLAAWLKDHPETKLAFQPGTFQISLGAEKLPDIFSLTEIFFCNLEEAGRILKAPAEKEVSILLASLRALGPKIVVLTDGPHGAFAYDGTTTWQMPIYPDPKPPVDRTGAGDAFASTFTAMIALGSSIPEALRRAPINSMSVVQHVGAQKGLLTKEELDQYLAEAPAGYEPKLLGQEPNTKEAIPRQ
jgi:ribokinase